MTLFRIFFVVALVLFGSIGLVAVVKKTKKQDKAVQSTKELVQINPSKSFESGPIEIDISTLSQKTNRSSPEEGEKPSPSVEKASLHAKPALAMVDHTDLLFKKNSPLPIVETIKYKSRVSWKSGRSAWPVDYAYHYNTPLDFIARGINGRKEYAIKNVTDGVEFNVLRQDKPFSFHLVLDLSRCMMWLYYVDPKAEEHGLLKTYKVGLGKKDSSHASGSLTPLGTFSLGKRVAVFKPKMMGLHHMKQVELMQVFGTRWIPFERALSNCTEPAKGYGIHGAPWVFDEKSQKLREDASSIGGYESDGCIRMQKDDVEELYSIISTREGAIEIVEDFSMAKVPYKERKDS